MIWVMLFVFATAQKVQVEYGPTFETEQQCLQAKDFQDSDSLLMRTYCVPMEGE